jgi:hypothetical protein
MRRFSQVSGNTAKQISDSLNEVSDSISIITNEVNQVNGVAIEQADPHRKSPLP